MDQATEGLGSQAEWSHPTAWVKASGAETRGRREGRLQLEGSRNRPGRSSEVSRPAWLRPQGGLQALCPWL